MSFTVVDTVCSLSLDQIYFTLKQFHSSGDSTISHYDLTMEEVRIMFLDDSTLVTVGHIPFEDGDSVMISLDSLYDNSGCVTKP
jgi:hypothetical protein